MSHIRALGVVAVAAVCLVACGSTGPEPTTTSVAPPPVSSSPSATSSAPAADAEMDSVEKVQEKFASLAPESFFAGLETCDPNGIPGSSSCSGPQVGQFQFFDSMTKATSTAQLLRELRSSRVVAEAGDIVVGWSAVGSTAIITVVDERQGLVMQQMISSDKVDPEDRIAELGLDPTDQSHSSGSAEES